MKGTAQSPWAEHVPSLGEGVWVSKKTFEVVGLKQRKEWVCLHYDGEPSEEHAGDEDMMDEDDAQDLSIRSRRPMAEAGSIERGDGESSSGADVEDIFLQYTWLY